MHLRNFHFQFKHKHNSNRNYVFSNFTVGCIEFTILLIPSCAILNCLASLLWCPSFICCADIFSLSRSRCSALIILSSSTLRLRRFLTLSTTKSRPLRVFISTTNIFAARINTEETWKPFRCSTWSNVLCSQELQLVKSFSCKSLCWRFTVRSRYSKKNDYCKIVTLSVYRFAHQNICCRNSWCVWREQWSFV